MLREQDHRIFFEIKNDIGVSFAPKTFQHIMDRLFQPTNMDGHLEVTVFVQNDLSVLEQILKLPTLKSFEVYVAPPNPDENDPETEKVLNMLDKLNAKEKTTKLTKKAGRSTLKLDEPTLREARVAGSGNGYVHAKGLDAKKNKADLKTSDHPMKIAKKVASFGGITALNHILRTAKETVIGKRR